MLFLPLIFFIASTASAFFNPYPRGKTVEFEGNGDVGTRLILTPYIEAGKIQEARNLSFVQPLKGDVKSYSGFVTVDKKCDSNMFFWFFPAEHGMEKAPVSVWLQGGPGASSLYGLLSENGPYMLKSSNKLELRKYSWTQFSSVIYIDNPVGVGYSYAKSEDCYSKTEEEVGKNLLLAVKQILKLFPEIKSNPFFVTGESYAGKYGPALAYAIHKDKDTSQKINLQGLALGNAFVDPINQLDYSDYLYQLGLLDENGKAYMRKIEDKCRLLMSNKKWMDSYRCLDELLTGEGADVEPSYFFNVTGFEEYYNYLYPGGQPEGNMTEFITRDLVRKHIHVGNATWYNGTAVEMKLREDISQSVRPWLEELLEYYRVLLYSGQLDIIVAYPLTEDYLQKMKWSAAGGYKTAKRQIWRVDKTIAGYARSAGKLTEVLVRNAGHMVPMDQPKWSFDLLSRFLNNKTYA